MQKEQIVSDRSFCSRMFSAWAIAKTYDRDDLLLDDSRERDKLEVKREVELFNLIR